MARRPPGFADPRPARRRDCPLRALWMIPLLGCSNAPRARRKTRNGRSQHPRARCRPLLLRRKAAHVLESVGSDDKQLCSRAHSRVLLALAAEASRRRPSHPNTAALRRSRQRLKPRAGTPRVSRPAPFVRTSDWLSPQTGPRIGRLPSVPVARRRGPLGSSAARFTGGRCRRHDWRRSRSRWVVVQ